MIDLVFFAVVTPISRLYAPLPEDHRKPRPKFLPKKGKMQFLGKNSSEVFRTLLNHGYAGLWITSGRPEEVRKKYRLVLTPILWLTTERDDELSIAPTKLERILKICQHFLLNAREPAIFIEYPETLVSANGLKKMVEFLEKLERLCEKEKAVLIVREVGLKEREIQEIKKAISE